jgi:hypothetical protein
MKLTALATILALLSPPLYAGDTMNKPSDICPKLGEFAHVVMSNRQGGVPLSAALGTTDEDLLKSIILQAYTEPRWSTDASRLRAAQDFRNEVEVMCYQTLG